MRKNYLTSRAGAALMLLSFAVTPLNGFAIETAAAAQQQQSAATATVKGTVVDEEGEPLIGVSVIAADSKTGVATDFDGNFSLNVKLPTVLTFTYVGYQPEKVNVTSAYPPPEC